MASQHTRPRLQCLSPRRLQSSSSSFSLPTHHSQ